MEIKTESVYWSKVTSGLEVYKEAEYSWLKKKLKVMVALYSEEEYITLLEAFSFWRGGKLSF